MYTLGGMKVMVSVINENLLKFHRNFFVSYRPLKMYKWYVLLHANNILFISLKCILGTIH